MDRTLDYRIGGPLDPRNKQYRVGAASDDLTQRSRYWVPGPVLDQGREGACVGFGCTAEAMASPLRVRFESVRPAHLPKPSQTAMGEATAHDHYRLAKEIDEWHGENYEGTSVLAGMKVGQERGWWSGYRWAMSMAELRAALEEGPVVVGVEWRSGMYRTSPDGFVFTAGQVVGGHCLIITGYSPDWKRLGPTYRWRNSWGPGYGRNGSGWIRAMELDQILFQAGGEAAVPVGRAA